MILDRELEKAKIDLVDTCRDFNLFDTFRILDRDGRGQISAHDLKNAFDTNPDLDLGQITIEDIELLLARYDKDGDRKIRFSEYSSMFCPVD
jgi:Ca2+-binding EF-hand superfamily protein